MSSLRILYDVPGWAYHYESLALQKFAPSGWDVSLAAVPTAEDAAVAVGTIEVDLIFLLAERKTLAVRRVIEQRRWATKLVVGWSSGMRRRADLFETCGSAADAWIFNNRGAWEAIGQVPSSYMIANGVDLDIFNVRRPPERRAPKVLWTGSEQYRELKGYDDIVLPLCAKLRPLGIECETWLVDSRGDQRRNQAQMAAWYNEGTVLICASQSEGTPNPALEAAACGCTVVSTPVGNMPELIKDDINGYLVDRNLDSFFSAVTSACEHYPRLSAGMQQSIRGWHWRERSRELFAVFEAVLNGA